MERCATTSDQYNQGKGEMCSWFIKEWKILIKTFNQYSRVTEACVFFSCFCLYWNIKIMRLKLLSNFLFLGSGVGKRKGGGGGGDMRSEEHFNVISWWHPAVNMLLWNKFTGESVKFKRESFLTECQKPRLLQSSFEKRKIVSKGQWVCEF